jgi:hypothetical protein
MDYAVAGMDRLHALRCEYFGVRAEAHDEDSSVLRLRDFENEIGFVSRIDAYMMRQDYFDHIIHIFSDFLDIFRCWSLLIFTI